MCSHLLKGSLLSSDQVAQGFILLSLINPQGQKAQLDSLMVKKRFSLCSVCTSPLLAYTHYFSVSERACLHLLINHHKGINKLKLGPQQAVSPPHSPCRAKAQILSPLLHMIPFVFFFWGTKTEHSETRSNGC